MNFDVKNNFKLNTDKITSIHSRQNFKLSTKTTENDIMGLSEDTFMNQETYTKSEIDLKLANLESRIDSKFEQLNLKLDHSVQHILSETKNIMLEQQIKEKDEREKERKTTNRWLIGLTASIGIALLKYVVG